MGRLGPAALFLRGTIVDLSFTEEENMVRESVAQVLEKSCDFYRVKELEESDAGYDPELWSQLAELEMLGTFYPEEYGGSELPYIYTAIVLQEIGKRAVPAPYHTCVVQAGELILRGGSDEQKKTLLSGITSGEKIVVPALYEDDGGYSETGIQATADADGRLNGTKLFAQDANIADTLIVAARNDAGVGLYLVDRESAGVTVSKIPTVNMDNTCEVVLENAAGTLLGGAGDGTRLIDEMTAVASALKSAEMVGGMQGALEMTVAYSKDREQYGRPIGGYQVLQHYMANMLMGLDTAGTYLYKVIWMLDEEMDEFTAEASALKAYCNEQYNYVSERAIQIHGGIGTTRECHVGLFYRRAKAASYINGDTRHHYEQVAATALGL